MLKQERQGRLQAEKSPGQIHIHELVSHLACEHAKAVKIAQEIAKHLRRSRMRRRVAPEKAWGMPSELWGTGGIRPQPERLKERSSLGGEQCASSGAEL